jgi:3-phenylpropionate/cinnamic acid dioxygenase small subunit
MTLQAGDYQDIEDVLACSNLAIDQADITAWMSCFANDAVFHISDASGRTVTRKAGGIELREYATSAARSSHGAGVTRRWNGSILIEGDGDTADVRSYLVVATCGRDQRVVATGVMQDRVRKIDGKWLFQERKVALDGGGL